ncbi:MAG: GNAT family N-acetyltransferase [Bacteroides sp.]|nr:GNAT family N-acetyltransferase [Barnesiella sp.]MBD5315504.1 GNAT family N-acetyltransferase [Bacteroides sp.]
MDIVIRDARKGDASMLARVIMMGVGEEISKEFAGPDHSLDDVHRVFTRLCEMEDSQYSYRNSLVATSPDGEFAGGIIGYDGAMLYALRKAFFRVAEEELGYSLEGEISDETSPDEYYFDSLAVMPQWRGHGVASLLLQAMAKRAELSGKPCGLLVDKDNHSARRLYERCGFEYVGDRPFAGVMMDHLQRKK